MVLELQLHEGGICYQGRLRGIASTHKIDSSDNTRMAWLLHTVVATKNIEKVAEKITFVNGKKV